MTETTALLLSMAIEAPIGYLVARLARWPCRGALHVGLACAVATAVTHPQLWTAAYWAFQYYSYWPSVLALEIAVVVAEGLLIAWMAQLTLARAMLVSLIANFCSCVAGLTLFA